MGKPVYQTVKLDKVWNRNAICHNTVTHIDRATTSLRAKSILIGIMTNNLYFTNCVPLIKSLTTLIKWKCMPCLCPVWGTWLHIYTPRHWKHRIQMVCSRVSGVIWLGFWYTLNFVVHIWIIMYELDRWTVCVLTRVIITNYLPCFKTAEVIKITGCWWPHQFITRHDNYDPSMWVSFAAI